MAMTEIILLATNLWLLAVVEKYCIVWHACVWASNVVSVVLHVACVCVWQKLCESVWHVCVCGIVWYFVWWKLCGSNR